MTEINLATRILFRTSENIAFASNTWEGWKVMFETNCGIVIIDDDSRNGEREIVNFRQAVNGLARCTVKQIFLG